MTHEEYIAEARKRLPKAEDYCRVTPRVSGDLIDIIFDDVPWLLERIEKLELVVEAAKLVFDMNDDSEEAIDFRCDLVGVDTMWEALRKTLAACEEETT